MVNLVKITLSILRVAAQASFFLEAQRLLLRLLRPTRQNHLCRVESAILRRVRSKLEHRWVRDNNGNTIHVICARSSRGSPQSTQNVVLLHGHSMSATFWYRNIDDLVSLGYNVYAVDLLGWGRSTRPRFRGHTPEDSIKWYLSSFSTVVQNLGLKSFTLVGHSLGAYLAMEYTKRNSAKIDHLVLISPAASTRKIPVSKAVYFSLPPQSIARRGGVLGFILFHMKYPREKTYMSDRLREYTYHLATQSPPSGEAAIRPIIRLFGPTRAECIRPIIEHLQLFRTPVRLVCGETDSSMPVESVHELYAEMKRQGFRVQLRVVEGADHCPMLEKPDDFFDVMASLGKRVIDVEPELSLSTVR